MSGEVKSRTYEIHASGRVSGESNDFVMKLPQTISRCVGAKFLSGSVPNEFMTISPDACTMYFWSSTGTPANPPLTDLYEVDLSDHYGHHSPEELNNIIQDEFDNQYGAGVFNSHMYYDTRYSWERTGATPKPNWRVGPDYCAQSGDYFMTDVLKYDPDDPNNLVWINIEFTAQENVAVDRAMDQIYVCSNRLSDIDSHQVAGLEALNGREIGTIPPVPGENTFKSAPYPQINPTFRYDPPRKMDLIDFQIVYKASHNQKKVFPLYMGTHEAVFFMQFLYI